MPLYNPTVSPQQFASTGLGTRDPNPGSMRFTPGGAIPTVMASPPTVGAASTTSALGSGVMTQATVGNNAVNTAVPWRYLSTRTVAIAGLTFPNYLYVVPVNVASPAENLTFSVEFEIDTALFEFQTKGFSAFSYRLSVDGQYVTAAAQTPVPQDGGVYYVPVTFAARGKHRILLELGGPCYFGGIKIGATDTMWPTSYPKGPNIIILGDSFTEGTGATSALSGFPKVLGNLLGWHDVNPSGEGGTGFLNPSTGGKTTYRSRVQADVLAYSPDIVLVCGGLNDYTYNPGGGVVTPSQIQTEAALLFSTIRAALPSVKLLATGPWFGSGSPPAALIQCRDAIKAAGVGLLDLFIDNIGGTYPYDGTAAHYVNTGWMTGTGKVGTTTGSGNADLYTSSDGTHPSQPGHDYLGYRLAAAIAAALPL